jgi:hypothetical protein
MNRLWSHAAKLTLGAAALVAIDFAPNSIPSAEANPRNVDVIITDHGFRPGNVLAALNQPLQIRVVNQGRKVHQFSIPYYRIYTENLAPGKVSTIGFAPWTSGRFEFISDPSGANKPEFTGWLTVVDGPQGLK